MEPAGQLDHILSRIGSIRAQLRELGVERLGVFGSHARGEATAASDVDILVDMRIKPFDAYFDVKELLEAVLGQAVDLIMSGALHPGLKPYVLAEVHYLEGS